MTNKIKIFFKNANLNIKTEMAFLLLINIVLVGGTVATFIFTNNNLLFIPFIFLIVLINGACFYRYIFLYSKNIADKSKEFVSLFRYLYLDINNEVKANKALLNIKERASLRMNEKLETLFNEKKEDLTFRPYLNFSSNFNNVLIEETLLNFYRYEKHSHKENLKAFNESYLKLKKSFEEETVIEGNKHFEFIKTTAIIGTALIILLVIVVTIMLVEGYIHG